MRVCIFEVFELKFTVICLSLRNWIKIGIKDSRIPIFIIFLMERVGSVLEKAAAQSVDAATTALIPGLSSKLLILSIMQTIMCSDSFFPGKLVDVETFADIFNNPFNQELLKNLWIITC